MSGSVTAGNASGINDGAAALVLATQSAAREKGLTGLVTLEAVAAAAMDPALMGYAPVLALQSLFEQAGTTPGDTWSSVEFELAILCNTVRSLSPSARRSSVTRGSDPVGHLPPAVQGHGVP